MHGAEGAGCSEVGGQETVWEVLDGFGGGLVGGSGYGNAGENTSEALKFRVVETLGLHFLMHCKGG